MKFHPNHTMGKWSNIWGNLGGEFQEKKTYKFKSKNEYMYEVSPKSENGQI